MKFFDKEPIFRHPPSMESEIRYFCLACLGTEFYIATLDLIDGTQAWVHMCIECNIRMEYSGTDHLD